MSGCAPIPRWFRLAIPTGLSLSRIVLAALFPLVGPGGRIALVALAAATDGADGASARGLSVSSRWGGFVDAAADKVFAVAVLVTLWLEGSFAVWMILALLVRDATVVSLLSVALARRRWDLVRRMGSHRLPGKAATAALLVFLLFALACPSAERAFAALFAVAAGLSVIAAVDYLVERVPLFKG